MAVPARGIALAAASVLAVALTGCATYNDGYGYPNAPVSSYPGPYPQRVPTYPAQSQGYVEYGRITQVALVSAGTSPPPIANPGIGAAIGAIVGGLLGHQIGHGGGRAAATVIGSAGGAVVGERVARGGSAPTPYANTGTPVYRVWIQTDSGQMRTYDVSATGTFRPGDRVRIQNGMIYMA